MPDVVLIEGMSGCEALIKDIVRRETQPPIAILAYTDELPVRTVVYPLATYSPEYQAMLWANEHHAEVRFIDLPADVFLALNEVAPALEVEGDGDQGGVPTTEEMEAAAQEAHPTDNDEDGTWDDSMALEFAEKRGPSLYERFAEQAGELDYDSYWERNFEHNLSPDSYRRAALELGNGLRDLDESSERWQAENLVREAFMRRRIQQVLDSGVSAEKVVAVVGAFHAPVLGDDWPAMTDEEFARLPRRASRLTLMPYSYFRLSAQSGYGAGNNAPAYFDLMWKSLEQGALDDLPHRYLTNVARRLRAAGTHRSTAEVIESVRLARTLSALKQGLAPTLRDLRDAAITLIGQGEVSRVAEALAHADVGTAIGHLPEGVSRTSIQEDFERELKRLRLEKYRSTVKQDLQLDLRENRTAKSADAAFLDLRRSAFLHRLKALRMEFARPQTAHQQQANWAEHWQLQWTPESEIQLVEAVLLGETIELATSYKFQDVLSKCTSVTEAASVVRAACECQLFASMEQARRRLQELSVETSDFAGIAQAAVELGAVVRYGDVRQFDASSLRPLIAELFVQGSLALLPAALCDAPTAQVRVAAMEQLNRINLEFSELVDEELWTAQLHRLADRDDRSPLMSGYACAILLERGLLTNEELSREVSRRLSPGISADLGAAWFEGLALRNHYALIGRQRLWECLADYVTSLDDEQFRPAIVFLRRAFGTFSPLEKRQIAENLGQYWGVSADLASELLNEELTEEEEQALEGLNDFDFDDL
ncbi:MAG: hypothetical protein KDA83_06855 [Planctomycetales bacterium]|nr:hypothetical protein [Planctomycetales bacterium]